MKTTFVLGAGFSVDAGFPLVRDLLESVVGFMKFDRHSIYARHLERTFECPNGPFRAGLAEADPGGKLQFEELFSKLRKMTNEPNYKGFARVTERDLRYGCARLFWYFHGLNPFPGWHYRKFADRLICDSDCSTIVSFNWDVVAETALNEVHLLWSYSLGTPHEVAVLKPHGSINWNSYLRNNLRNESGDWQPIGPGSRFSYMAEAPLKNPDQDMVNPDLLYALFPGDPDTPEHDEDLMRIWNDVEKELEASDKVVFIGYSLPDYDCFASEFFRERTIGKEIEVYNPKEAGLQKYKALFGAGVRLYKDTFAACPYAK